MVKIPSLTKKLFILLNINKMKKIVKRLQSAELCQNMKILGFIPARSGSKRLKDKNFKSFRKTINISYDKIFKKN